MPQKRRKPLVIGVLLAVSIMGGSLRANAFPVFWGLGELARLTVFEGAAGLVAQVAEMVASIKEQTTLFKTAYRGIDALAHGGWDQISEEMWRGLSRNPEIASLYRDIRDIDDLRYTNARAERTLNNMLFEHVFGPAADYIHSQADDMNALSVAAETRERHELLIGGERVIVKNLREACEKGAGGCSAAADAASIEQISVLSDMHELMQRSLEMQERMVERNGKEERDAYYAHLKFAEDYFEYASAVYGYDASGYCPAGECIERAYAGARNRVLNEARSRVRRRQRDAVSRLHSPQGKR